MEAKLMQRGLGFALVWTCLCGSLAVAQSEKTDSPGEQQAQTANNDAVSDLASRLEAELGKFNDLAPEAAEAMVKLVDLYHANGRLFGLIRVGNRFVATHLADPRHRDVMLKLMDGLEATARNKDLSVVCRQFLIRYPEDAECANIEIRLARTLAQLGNIPATADAYRAVWKRQPTTPVGRRHGQEAVRLYTSVNNKKIYTKAAELAEEMLDKLAVGEFAMHAGWHSVLQFRRGGEWARSNIVANKLLKKGLPKDKQGQHDLYRMMAESYGSLGQHANAVRSLKQARALGDNQYLHMLMITRMYYANAKPEELETVVNEYVQKYPTRPDRHLARGYLAHAYLRAGNKPRGLQILVQVLPFDASSNGNASIYVSQMGIEAGKPAESERVLRDAIAKNKLHGAYLRYTLAFQVYRDQMKAPAKTKQTLRELLLQSASNDGYSSTSIAWLLGNAENEQEFQADVARIVAARKKFIELPAFRTYLENWALQAKKRKDADSKRRAAYVQNALAKADQDPVVRAWLQIGTYRDKKGEGVRNSLLQPALFNQLSDGAAKLILQTQAYYYWYSSTAAKRKLASSVYGQWSKRFPDDFQAAYNYLDTAVNYSAKEVQKEAALNLLSKEPSFINATIWLRLIQAADKNEDPVLVKRVYEWIKKSEQKFGPQAIYGYYVGDVLLKYKFETEALEIWNRYLTFDRKQSDSLNCATRLLARLEGAAKVPFLQELLKYDTDFHGAYATWLADYYLQEGDLDNFEKILLAARKRQNERPFRAWSVYEYTVQPWVDKYRNSKEATEADKRRVFTAVRDFDVVRPSAAATLALLELTPADSQSPVQRLLAYQQVTQIVTDSSTDWDRLMPYAQVAMTNQEYASAASLLTGMLSNITSVTANRKKSGREMLTQCYSRMGAVGLTIDENSPVAPLLQAALYLRLGDEKLAFDTYLTNKRLFDENRNEVPVDLVLFVCENLIVAGGDKNHDQVEDILRTWMVKFSEAKHLKEVTKARVQLMLAKNFFKSQRYDLARSEFTTVINRYPKTSQAVEAEFGIGETFMAQKVYDQAEAVFEKLASSRDADVIVRAEFLRGVLASRRGDRDEARDIFRSVLERVPNIELANQTLFNLAEVYGSEERFIDQLNLLRTVGRLGRLSKRWHQPGTALSIVVQDSDLGISRGHNKIPVRVTTEPGGDSEMVYLTSGGAGKGLFRADLETRLGEIVKGDDVLQISGKDVIKCDYPDEFKREFKHVSLSDVEIQIASDAKFEMASSKIIDREEETITQQLRREAAARESADRRVSQGRPANQIKPGNIVYLRVQDPDRDLTNEPDKTVIKLAADSGDQLQLSLTETGPHTGIFEGTARTGELPAGALASDTSIEHSPLMAIDRDPGTYWLSEPDGMTPKWLTVDMKDLQFVSRVKISTPDPDQHAPVRGKLLGSNDGRFWFRLASNPVEPKVEAVANEFADMKRRVYDGNYTNYTTWNQVVNLGRNAKPIEEETVEELFWERPETVEDSVRGRAVIWHGKLVQEREGAARIMVQGIRTAVSIDGHIELPVGPGGRSVDVWLESGTHDLTIFSAMRTADRQVSATWVRANHDEQRVILRPFRKSDFDLSLPAASQDAPSQDDSYQVRISDRDWEFNIKPMELRYVKFVVEEYLGEAVAINHIEVSGDDADDLYIPTETDVLALSNNEILEIAGGDLVRATYADELTQSESGRSRLLTSTLTATYYNASIAPIAYDFVKQPNGAVATIPKQLMRIDPADRIIVEIIDYDQDESDAPDQIPFQVFVNDGAPIDFIATETEEYSGIFTKEIDTSARKEEGKIQVKPGDRIYCRYIDVQNTFPGHAVPRESLVFVNEPSEAQIRVFETRVTLPAANSQARPRVVYRLPEDADALSGVAFEAPLTVEVIDPDAAKDSRSTVIVDLKTTDGATVQVECVVSDRFRNQQSRFIDDRLALREGRFIGQIILQLGGASSPVTVPLNSEMPRNLVGRPYVEEGEEGFSAIDRTLVTRVLNLTGKDIVSAGYRDQLRPTGPAKVLASRGRLITNGQLACTDRDYEDPATQLHVGEKLFLMVSDADQDSSDGRDKISVEITSEQGEEENVELFETLSHSGIFTGSFELKPNEKPVQNNFKTEDPFIESYFGDTLHLRYVDETASTESGKLEVHQDIPVVIGTDGLVAAFSKTFNDENLAVETKFHIAESYFELFKSHKKLKRPDEQQTDLEAGRRVLREVMEDYPDPKYVPRISYLLGQFSQELERWSEAISSYELIVRQYADHSLAADAQYKLAQCYEESGDFDQALEAYVTLAATYPKSPLIANVMIRISDHFYKGENYDVAAQVGEKFLDRFKSHQFASRMAFRVGQCYFKSEEFPKAGASFDVFAKAFSDDVLCADALFWSGESFRMGRNNREAFRRYNRCRWDFPASDAAKYARGRLALPEMLQQFEASINSLDDE